MHIRSAANDDTSLLTQQVIKGKLYLKGPLWRQRMLDADIGTALNNRRQMVGSGQFDKFSPDAQILGQ